MKAKIRTKNVIKSAFIAYYIRRVPENEHQNGLINMATQFTHMYGILSILTIEGTETVAMKGIALSQWIFGKIA